MASTSASVARGGARQFQPVASGVLKKQVRTDFIGRSMGRFGGLKSEVAISRVQVDALRTLYFSQPAIQACRSVLLGELLANGFELLRDGKRVELTSEFNSHLSEHWIPFARDVVDSFLIAGFCVVDVLTIPTLVNGRKRRNGATVPICAPLETFQLAYNYEASKYQREYVVYPMLEFGSVERDDNVDVFVRTHPDAHGNVISPTSTSHELGSAQLAMVELAVKAESLRAKQMIVCQPAERKQNDDPLGAASQFFDSESRAIQANFESESNSDATAALKMQMHMCNVINKLQTRGDDHALLMDRFQKSGKRNESFVPPSSKPELMALPKEFTSSSGSLVQAEARSDLVAISQHAQTGFCTAFGVPASLVLEQRFVGNQSTSLRLFNSTVEQLALSVERVLTSAYRKIYNAAESADTLRLQVSPLAAVPELVMLNQAGIADAETVQGLALRSVGLSLEEIEAAGKRLKEQREQTNQLANEAAQVAAAQVAAAAAESEEKRRLRASNGGVLPSSAAGAGGGSNAAR